MREALPSPRRANHTSSTLNGQTFNWGRIVTAGGSHVLSGTALFTKFQPIYDPGITWVRDSARRRTVTYWPAASGVPANTYARSIVEAPATSRWLITPGVVSASSLLGNGSWTGKTGAFTPTAALASGVTSGNRVVISESGQPNPVSPNDSRLLGEP